MEISPMENAQVQQDAFFQETSTPPKLQGAWKLFKESLLLFRSKFKTLLAIMLLPVFVNLLLHQPQILSTTSEMLSQSFLFSILKVLLWLISLYVGAISTLAVVFSIKDNATAKESYSKATKNGIAYILMILFGALVTIGSFVLLIIPSILFMVWLSLIIYVFAFEDTRGLTALRRSKQLIQGNFWKVVWRTFIFMPIAAIVLCIPFIILGVIFGDRYNLITSGVLLLIYPIVLIFELQLYKNLSELKKDSFLEEPKGIHKFGYYFTTIIAIPLFSAFALLQALSLIAYDIPNPSDSDLQLQVLNIPKQENAYYAFLESKDKIYLPEDKLAEGLDDSLAQEIVQKNEQAMSSFEKGVSLSIYQQPEFQNPKNYNANQVVESVSFLRNLARVNSIEAVILQSQGKEKEALDQSLKTIKMAQMIQDSQGTLINYLIGLAIKEIGLSNFRELVLHSNLQPSELLSYEAKLDPYKESKLSLQRALKSEYIMLINSKETLIDPVFRGEKPAEDSGELLQGVPQVLAKSNFYYQPNRTKLLFIQTYQNMLSNSDKKNYSMVSHAEKMPIGWTIVFENNAVGKILSGVVNVSFDSLFEKRFEENFSVKATQLLIALKAYKQTTGNLPDSLTALVPNYIPTAIQDPFDGNPIRYSKDEEVIYSIGKNLKDDSGNISEDDWRQGEDFGFKLSF